MSDHLLNAALIQQLAQPFPIGQIEVRPGAVRQDGSAALALPYADWRVYADRLDAVVGPANWCIQLVPWGDTRVIARLTICGVTKDASGEGEPGDDNCGTIAEAQAKKRACAEFQLGRYLYHLPKVWGKGQGDRSTYIFDDPAGIVYRIYTTAGLPTADPASRASSPTPRSEQPGANGTGHPAPSRERLMQARAVLAAAEQGQVPPIPDAPPATDRQRGAISALLAHCAEQGVSPDAVDQLGVAQGLLRLSSIRRAANLPAGLSKSGASTLIGELERLLHAAQG